MTDQELQQLAREYAEQHPPQIEDEKLREFGMFLNATEVFEPFLYWLTKTHCIVSLDTVTNLHRVISLSRKYNQGDEMYDKGALNVLDGLFGKSTFDERSEK